MTGNDETVSPIRRAAAEFNVARWMAGKCPVRDRPSYEDLAIAGYSVVATEDLHAMQAVGNARSPE